MVQYRIDDLQLHHSAYMRVVLGPGGGNRYPGFSGDALDGFCHWAHDLSQYCGVFLSGSNQDFEAIAQKAAVDTKVAGINRLQ